MKKQEKIYFIGWDYSTPDSIALKKLISHPLSPWKIEAIIHDDIYVPSVDGIPLMTTEEFLKICKTRPGTQATISVKHPAHQKLWYRRSKEYKIIIIDEGEIFQSTCEDLKSHSLEIDLGIMQLPMSLKNDCIESLSHSIDDLNDSKSKEILRAYILFLKSGLLEVFKPHTKSQPENPLTRPPEENWLLSCDWKDINRKAIAWEFSAQRSSFLEQAMLLGSGSLERWSYAYTTQKKNNAEREKNNLLTIFNPFGIKPFISYLDLHINSPLDKQITISQEQLPDWKNSYILAHINLPNSFSIIKRLSEHNNSKDLLIRLGHSPIDLLLLLQNFPENIVSLRCDRPGPMGLHAHLKFR